MVMRHVGRGLSALFALLVGTSVWAAEPHPATPLQSTADHSSFQVLQQDFQSGPEVTKACLTCHTNAAKQIHKTEHWNWEYKNPKTNQVLGKRHVINTFCTSALTNQVHCAECHIGYNFKDESFDFTSQENVDCLVCHDTTGRYKKDGWNYGNPLKSIKLKVIAQGVGKTKRANCGECHFNGGAGNGVKHGDLDNSLEEPSKALDVHMDEKGLDFTCATCHKTEAHQVSGSRYAPTAADAKPAMMRGEEAKDRNPATCQACHGMKPHKLAKMNDHTDRIACQTCHIPAYARGGNPTKMSWDWSTAGKLAPNGKSILKKDDDGYELYSSEKGDATWAENVVPEYVWFNGTVKWLTMGEKVDSTKGPVDINTYEGSPTDGKSRIWPVKVFHGKQMFDPVNQTLAVTHLAGQDDTAFWTNFNIEKAVASGMQSVNLPFSGKVGFVESRMTWPITHMVAPKEKALACQDCHASNGRLEKVSGIYIPGRTSDHKPWLEFLGWAIAALTLLAALGHGLARIVTSSRRK